MPTGKVKRLMKDRGFGFIRGNDGQEVFFHRSSLEGIDFESLTEGQEVDFEIEQSPKGPRAGKVRAAGAH
jgi:CspA family cold shock protein